MPRKGMRSIFFRSHTTLIPSVSSNGNRSSSSTIYSFSESMINETFAAAEEIINKWNPDTSTYAKVTSLFHEDRKEAKDFIKCVKDLQRAMHFLLYKDPTSEKLVQAQNLMQTSMKRLEKEFYQILSANRDHLDPESISGRTSRASERSSRSSASDYYEDDVAGSEDEIQIAGNSISEVEQVSTLAMADIKTIVECMISAGYGKECVRIYKIIRKSIIDEGLYRLGIEHLKSHQIRKMDWEIVELKIKNWLNSVKIAVKTLFSGERILCDHVFSSSDAIRESCFSEISKEGAIMLFSFPKKVTKCKKSPEKVFRILDLYSAISNLWPEIEYIFSFESTSVVRSTALTSLIRLTEEVRIMITDFESAIQKDSSKSTVHGGGIHPLTRYCMNYLSLLADYSGILSDIFADWPLPTQSPLPDSYFESPKSNDTPVSALSLRFAWLILVLLCKLDRKVEFYKDVSLSYLFLANNLNYVVSKVRRSNLELIIGYDWITNHEAKVKQYAANYERIGWNKVFSALPENQNDVISSEEVKNRFKRFNSAFEVTYRTQSSWLVPDSKLRNEIENSISQKLVPAYTQFYEKYRGLRRLVKYTPDELSTCLADLFQGTRVSGSSESSWSR